MPWDALAKIYYRSMSSDIGAPAIDAWKAVEELTGVLREFDPSDPVKYDFALFGLGVNEKF